jgi:hypothetical protein
MRKRSAGLGLKKPPAASDTPGPVRNQVKVATDMQADHSGDISFLLFFPDPALVKKRVFFLYGGNGKICNFRAIR